MVISHDANAVSSAIYDLQRRTRVMHCDQLHLTLTDGTFEQDYCFWQVRLVLFDDGTATVTHDSPGHSPLFVILDPKCLDAPAFTLEYSKVDAALRIVNLDRLPVLTIAQAGDSPALKLAIPPEMNICPVNNPESTNDDSWGTW